MPTNEDESQPPPISLDLIDPSGLLSLGSQSNINTWAAAVFAHIKATGSVRAKVVNDQQMSAAHQQFSGIQGTTDVLTFDLNDQSTADPKTLDTDLIICFDEASRQAKEHNHTPAHELLLYIIHGTLHCLGYNDHSTEDYNTMHAREDVLLTAAGIGPLFFNHAINENTQS